MKRLIVMMALLFALAGVFVACSSGGGGGTDPAAGGSNWDQMHWEQGTWA